MTRLRLLSGALVLMMPSLALAHEKWFYEAMRFRTDWPQVARFPGIVSVAVAVLLTSVLGYLWKVRGRRDIIPGPSSLGATDANRATFYGLVPLILGVHVGVPLIVLGVRSALFSPNNELTGHWIYWLGVIQIGIGVSLIYGGFARPAGVLLICLWCVGTAVFGVEPMLENIHYLGFGAFFLLTGRGPYSIDRLLFPRLDPSPQLSARAMPFLRVCFGLALVFVAFTEKLANPALSLAFLQKYPLNFTPWIGVPLSDATFVQCAGATELLIGLALLFGYFPRTILITAWLFINMTLTIFEWVELVGHLPLYGVMCVLLIWTPDEEDRQLWKRGVLGVDK